MRKKVGKKGARPIMTAAATLRHTNKLLRGVHTSDVILSCESGNVHSLPQWFIKNCRDEECREKKIDTYNNALFFIQNPQAILCYRLQKFIETKHPKSTSTSATNITVSRTGPSGSLKISANRGFEFMSPLILTNNKRR